MTKERRLAIQMWEELKELLPLWYSMDRFALGEKVLTFKYNFCCNKKVDWLYNCWLCQYVRVQREIYNCRRCPLKTCGYLSCGDASPWQVVMQYRYSLEKKLAACDTIIAVLKGIKEDADGN